MMKFGIQNGLNVARAGFLTIIEMLASDGLEETINTLIFFSARIVNIFAAEPGAANNMPPLRSIKPIFRSAETHLTVFLVAVESVSVDIQI